MAARRGWSSDGGLSPAKHGRVPAFGTPPRRQRRRSSLLYGGAAENRPKNLRRALRGHGTRISAPERPQHGRYLRGPARTAANTVMGDQKQPYNRAGPHRRASHHTTRARVVMRQAIPSWRVLLLDQSSDHARRRRLLALCAGGQRAEAAPSMGLTRPSTSACTAPTDTRSSANSPERAPHPCVGRYSRPPNRRAASAAPTTTTITR